MYHLWGEIRWYTTADGGISSFQDFKVKDNIKIIVTVSDLNKVTQSIADLDYVINKCTQMRTILQTRINDYNAPLKYCDWM